MKSTTAAGDWKNVASPGRKRSSAVFLSGSDANLSIESSAAWHWRFCQKHGWLLSPHMCEQLTRIAKGGNFD